MPHTGQVNRFGNEFAGEFRQDRLRSLQEAIPSLSEALTRSQQFSETRGFNPRQQAATFAEAQQGQQNALLRAALQADIEAAERERQERLIEENRSFQVEQTESARREARRNQAFSAISGLVGSAAGGIGSLIAGASGGQAQKQGFQSQNDLLRAVVQALATQGLGGEVVGATGEGGDGGQDGNALIMLLLRALGNQGAMNPAGAR